MQNSSKLDSQDSYEDMKVKFVAAVRARFSDLSSEVAERNGKIQERDDYIYGDRLERSLDVPIGHDMTPVNWLRRTVEIHKGIFMNRGFQIISTYDSKNPENQEGQEKERVKIENTKQKEYAEARKMLIDSIQADNGGNALWSALAENASAVGDAAIKMFWNNDEEKIELCEIEAIENLYVLWSRDNFRKINAFGFAYQVSRQDAIRDFGAPEDVATSPLGKPMETISNQTSSQTPAVYGARTGTQGTFSSQPMVTILEVTGRIEGWGSEKGRCKQVKVGDENEINALIIGNEVTRLIDDPKKLPKYYILPNKRQRRRPWGVSDISDSAIYLNQTYIETLSDWRTHAAKVNFQKYKAYGFAADTQIPKSEPRKVQVIPLAEGQDLARLDQGESNKEDFMAQMEEVQTQFVTETGISRILLSDPSVALNSNQALLTSMKPTSDIAEAKKNLWSPILVQMFKDALDLVVSNKPELKPLVDEEDNWTLKVMWPSLMQKEDPVYQQMLLNRFNSNTMSLQSYLEAQGETKEEIDRIRDEMSDPLTASILGRVVNQLALQLIQPPSDKPQVRTSINLRGDLTPNQEANLATQSGFNDGPFPPSMGPQGIQGLNAQENQDNQGFLEGAKPGVTPIFKDQQGNPQQQGQKSDTNTGQDARPQVNTQANNQGTGAVSLPGSGQATPTGAQGALNQANQNAGQ